MKIFKTLAFAMLMPAMLLTTSCSNDDDTLTNNVNTANKGYTIPVSVNVTRQGNNTMRTSYNSETKKLGFTAGDKLFIDGATTSPSCTFAGILDYDAVSGKFTGELSLSKEYEGTYDDLFTAAGYIGAILLPAGYESYKFLSIGQIGEPYEYGLDLDYDFAVAADLATAVEQFSIEQATTYSNGFALTPKNAIVNVCYYNSEHASEKVTPGLFDNDENNFYGGGKDFAFDKEGYLRFAVSVPGNLSAKPWSLNGDANTQLENLGTKNLVAGHIYDWTKAASKALSEVTSSEKGWRIGSDGTVYEPTGALPTGVTAVAAIAYVGSETGDATYNHGLAIALADEGSMDQSTALSTCSDKNTSVTISNASWMLPSKDQWDTMCRANGGYSSKWTGLNTLITSTQGTGLLTDLYWTSYSYTVGYVDYGDCFDIRDNGDRFFPAKDQSSTHYVRAVLAF